MKAPPVLLISGDDTYRSRKRLFRLLGSLRGDGWNVSTAKENHLVQISRVFAGRVLIRRRNLLLLTETDKLKKELRGPLVEEALAHHKKPKPGATFLFFVEGTPKKGSVLTQLVKGLPKGRHLSFSLPKFWKQEGDAAEFCVEESQDRGKKLSLKLAGSLVSVVGTDLGMLHYEVSKVCSLLDFEGKTEITSSHLRGSICRLGEASVFSLTEALGSRNQRKVAAALRALQATHSGDITIKICRFLAPTVLKWFAASVLETKGLSLKEAAAELKQNQWYYKKQILPVAKRWGKTSLAQLLEVLADSERSVFQGRVSPWVLLSSRLLKLCR